MEQEQTSPSLPKRRNRVRSPALWAAIKADIVDGMSFIAASVKYDIRASTIRARANREGWRRCDIDAAKDAAMLESLVSADGGSEPDAATALDPKPLLQLIPETQKAYEAALAGGRARDAAHLSQALSNLRRTAGLNRARANDFGVDAEPEPGPPATPWLQIAHAAQKAPPDPWRTWVFMGGRGAGKTRAGAEWLDSLAQASPGGRFALIAPTFHDAREVMAGGESGLRNLPRPGRPWWETARRRLVWDNGAVAQAFSAEDPESLRGPQFHAAWADEFCAWRDPGPLLPLLRMGLRLGDDPRLLVTTTPKPLPALRALLAEPSCAVTRAPTSVNAAALPASFLDDLAALYGGTRLAAQELEGLLVEGEGALWRAEELARAHGPAPDRLDRVVVAVDPPATAGGDACGIVAAGRRGDRAYVLADATVRGHSPLGWAGVAAETARRWNAAVIVAESNQGGEMVRSTLRLAGAPCPVELAHAGRSKRARAEPVAALYEQGRVTHCGAFGALEEELMALGAEGPSPATSPDRADALVWALTDLMLGDPRPEPRIRTL